MMMNYDNCWSSDPLSSYICVVLDQAFLGILDFSDIQIIGFLYYILVMNIELCIFTCVCKLNSFDQLVFLGFLDLSEIQIIGFLYYSGDEY